MPLTPEEKAFRLRIHDQAVMAMNGYTQDLARMALGAVEHGCGAACVAALRSGNKPEFAACCVLISGKFTDDDMARLSDYANGMFQDGGAGGGETRILSNHNIAKKPDAED